MKHTLMMVRIARTNYIVLGGESGDEILRFFKDTNDLVFNEKVL